MSVWTYVNGVIKVDTFANSSARAMYVAQTVVNHLPKISGSECDVQYYLSLVEGYNLSSNCDEFDQPSNLCNRGRIHMFKAQTCVLITMDGSLRNREFHRTLFETTKALSRLSSRLLIQECLVSVRGFRESFVFDNPKWLLDRERTNWVRDLL